MKNKFLVFFETSRIVKGFKKSIIWDMQRSNIFNIPNSFVDFILQANKTSVNELIDKSNIETRGIIKEYVEFIEENELGTFVTKEEKNIFPKMDISWYMNSHITSLSIEIDKTDKNILHKLELLISTCNIKSIIIEIREFNRDQIELMLDVISNSPIGFCELLFFNSNGLIDQKALSILDTHGIKVNKVYIYNCIKNLIVKTLRHETYHIKESYEKVYKDKLNAFYPYIEYKINNYTESRKHNLYLNKKLHITAKGEIKNVRESDTIHGKINQIKTAADILKIINSSGFQKYWNVKKDDTLVCKQCEFRYICVDNRIPKKGKNNSWYYDAECIYNPFIAKWKDEEGYESLKESGVEMNADGLKINRTKLNKINTGIWGD